MRSSLVVCVIVCLALIATGANAATAAQVPDATLAQMGLSGMQPMTDAQGMNIRGGGFVVVSGSSFGFWTTGPYLKVAGPGVPNAYRAGSTIAVSFVGGYFSVAGGGAVAYAR